jgi:diguanylate cyclase (GGDEF)-like protein
MERQGTAPQFLVSLLVPGGVLLFCVWVVQQDVAVRTALAPSASTFCFGALAAAAFLAWYYDQSRLLCSVAALVLAVVALERPPADSRILPLTVMILLPLDFGLFGALKERGLMTPDGLAKVGIIVAQMLSIPWLAGHDQVGALLGWADRPDATGGLPWSAQLSFGIGALALLVLAFRRRTKIEHGLLWGLVAMFVGLNQRDESALFVYAGTAGLLLVFALLGHEHDIAYRDELTGLPGRRAFTYFMAQLGGTYAIAVCDVDHFKKFNDTYGHDAGDQVLRMVAAKLQRVGGGGRAFRYGGEEFLIVFRGRSAREAEPFAESLRRMIADAGFVPRGPDRPAVKTEHLPLPVRPIAPRVTITVSIGVAEQSARDSTPELVLDAADAAMYRAKEAGRNRVVLAGVPSAE